MKDLLSMLSFVLLGVFIVSFFVLFTINSIEKNNCKNISNDLNYEYKHYNMGGCYIKTKKGWVSLSNYKP